MPPADRARKVSIPYSHQKIPVLLTLFCRAGKRHTHQSRSVKGLQKGKNPKTSTGATDPYPRFQPTVSNYLHRLKGYVVKPHCL